MIKKIVFEGYKPFSGQYEIEIKPFTLIIGKNSSGKSSITHLVSLMSELIGSHHPVQYKSFTGEYINSNTFHNYQTTGLKLGVENDKGDEIQLSFVRNIGKRYLHQVDVLKNGVITHTYSYSSDERQELTDRLDFIRPLLNSWGIDLDDWAYSSNYIAPIRSIPNSVFSFNASNVGEVRSKGENIFDLMVDSYRGDKALLNKVSNWLYENMDHQRLTLEPLIGDYFSVEIDNGRGASVPLEEVGEGVSQVLPVLVQSFLPYRSDVTIVEQPVLHLHPAAHAAVADRLVESAMTDKKAYVVESHSANVLLALRRAVCNPKVRLTSQDAVVYFIDLDSQSPISRIDILDNGDLTSWPTGVFGEGFELMKDILKFQK